jgi:hypothetical protein
LIWRSWNAMQRMMEPQKSRKPDLAAVRLSLSMGLYWARVVLFVLLLVLAACLALPALLVGLVLWWIGKRVRDRGEYWRGVTATGLFCIVIYAVWIALASPLPGLWGSLRLDLARHLWHQAEHTAFLLWLFNLWFSPLVAPLLAGLSPVRRATARKVVPGQQKRSFALAPSRPQRAQAEPGTTPGAAVVVEATRIYTLGRFLGGEWAIPVQQDGLFAIPPEFFDVHGLVIGEPKAGKTTTLIKLAAIARMYGRRVIFIDLKGSRRTAALFYAAMRALQAEVRLYPAEAYDGWRGDAQSLYNRLMQQIDPSSHPFYRSGVGSTAVSLACKAPGGPPRNSYEFLRRLDMDWLEARYASDGQALREIASLAGHLSGVSLTFSGFFRGLAGGLDGAFAYEDCDACYIGVNGIAHREEAATLGRYLLDDAAHFATERMKPDDQALLIIDEFGVLESTNATRLYEQVRESGLCIYAAGQSYQALGRERDNLLAASAVKILHRCGSPEPIIQYAGKREVYKFSRSLGNKEATEPGDLYHPYANAPDEASAIMRPADEYTIPIETVQQLAPGHTVLIQSGQDAYVRVAALSVPAAALQSASDFIAQAGHYQPLTPPPPAPKKNAKKTGQQKNSKKDNAPGQATGATSTNSTDKPAQKASPEPIFPTPPALASAPSTSPDRSEKPPVLNEKEGDDTVDFFG